MDETDSIGGAGYHAMHYGRREPGFYTFLLLDLIRCGVPGPILDLGCGTGLFLELASQWGVKGVGLDGSQPGVALAAQQFPHLDIKHHRLSGRLPFLADTFGAVVLNQVIAHLAPDVQRNVLAESFRVLKPGGCLIVYAPSRASAEQVGRDATHCNPLLPSELRALLCDAGFEIVAEPTTARFLPHYPRLQRILRRLVSADWLSATASALARKPG